MSLYRFQDPDALARRDPAPGPHVQPVEADVERLRSVVGYPLVSILLGTTPGDRMASEDAIRLSAMLGDVERRLRAESTVHDAVRLADRCRSAAIELLDEPCGWGLALFVGADLVEVFRLPHTPTERVVIDPTFATRELEFAVRRSPGCRVVVIGPDVTRLFVVERGACEEQLTACFPVTGPVPHIGLRDHVSDVVSGILLDRASWGLPLILVGPRLVADAISTASGFETLAQVERRGGEMDTDSVLALAQSVTASVSARGSGHALDRLDRAVINGTAATGLEAVWTAAVQGTVQLAVIDRDFSQGAVVDPANGAAELVDDPTAPGAIDDLVDELIEFTMLAGGDVVFVDRGELGDDRVAAVCCASRQPVDLDRLKAVV